MHLKEQSVKKQAISRYYFLIASIQSSKKSSNYNKIVCIAGVIDTGNACIAGVVDTVDAPVGPLVVRQCI
jgi:hypothetical protein